MPWALKNWFFWTVVLEKTLESPVDCKEIQPVHLKGKSGLNIYWKDWCWSWNSSTLATWWEELTPWKRPWCWQRLKEGGKGDNRGWDGWKASLMRWTWVWVGSGSWWWKGKPGVLQSMGSQRVRHDWATELNGLGARLPIGTLKTGVLGISRGFPTPHLWVYLEKPVSCAVLLGKGDRCMWVVALTSGLGAAELTEAENCFFLFASHWNRVALQDLFSRVVTNSKWLSIASHYGDWRMGRT